MENTQPNKCIDCAFLCRLDPYKPTELRSQQRDSIRRCDMAKSLFREIRCFKHFHTNFYEKLKEMTQRDGMTRISEKNCPTKTDWLLHHDGLTPQQALEQQYANQSLNTAKTGVKWSKFAFWTVIISIILSIIFFILSQFVLNSSLN